MRKIGSLGFTFVLLFILATSGFAASETKTTVTTPQSKPATAQDNKVSEKMKVNSPIPSKTVNAKQPAQAQAPSSSPTTKNWFSYLKKFWATIVSVVLVVMMMFMYGKDTWAPKRS